MFNHIDSLNGLHNHPYFFTWTCAFFLPGSLEELKPTCSILNSCLAVSVLLISSSSLGRYFGSPCPYNHESRYLFKRSFSRTGAKVWNQFLLTREMLLNPFLREKMGSIIGHRIGYNGVGVPRGQHHILTQQKLNVTQQKVSP